jgi:hypothetical protein
MVKSTEELEGVREYNIMVRGSYCDMLNTEYSLQAGPGTLILKDFKESEKLLQKIESIKTKYQSLHSQVSETKIDSEPLDRILTGIETLFDTTQSDVSESRLELGKGRILVIESIIDTMDALLKDQELIDNIVKKHEREKREFTSAEIGSLKETIREKFENQLEQINGETEAALSEWDSRTSKKKTLIEQISDVMKQVSEITNDLENVYSKMPTAADTDNPEEAKSRTQLRTSIDSVKNKISSLDDLLREVSSAPMLEDEDRPKIPKNVAMAKESLEKFMKIILQHIDFKKSDLK